MKTKRRFFAAILAAVFVILNVAAALPVLALDDLTTRYPTPEGYNDHDYRKLVAFLEQTDDEGVKNGEKLRDNYDPNDPQTWNLEWVESDGELRIRIIYVYGCRLCGALDVSGCTALEDLICSGNNLTSLDVSNNTALEVLKCYDNNLTELDVSGCTALSSLRCYNNNLTTLDVSGCTALHYLICHNNNLTLLDVSGCTALWHLECHCNNLTALDVSGYTRLNTLWCYCNNLTELDVGGCTALEYLDCYSNNLTAFDVSGCTALSKFYCYNNNLIALDVSGCTALSLLNCSNNNLTALDVSSNTALEVLDCGINNLTSLDVSGCTALEELWCNNNNLTELDVSKKTALKSLYCYSNNLTELDVSKNTALEELWCYSNNLTELDVSKNTALEKLYCHNNNLTELDLSNNTKLLIDHIYTEGKGYAGYDYGWYYNFCNRLYAYPQDGESFLGWYNEDGELLSTYADWDITDRTEKVFIAKFTSGESGNDPEPGFVTPAGYNDHDYQKLVAFLEQTDDEGVKNGEKLRDNYDPNDPRTWYLNSSGGGVWVESDGERRIKTIDVMGRKLCGTLDVSGCTALKYLDCCFNNLTTLDVSGCTALLTLDCYSNKLSELDVSSNTALQHLECHYNNLTTLDVSNNTALSYLDCCYNNLTTLDVSGCTVLSYLLCKDNNLTELDLSNTNLPIDHIYTEGKGFVGYERYYNRRLYAVPQDGENFLGWYNEDGELLSTNAEWNIGGRKEKVFIAKFTGGEPEIIPGDADGDGELTFNDVTVLYYYLLNGDMTGMTPESLASADLNNDGVVSVSDITLMFNLLLGGN
ncbi:MAG: leucine-rich repeat domain-containing protein [Clostridia bacterium]|nr:leucine-rich repeat domain-containing protein [Clostridia bacterium]